MPHVFSQILSYFSADTLAESLDPDPQTEAVESSVAGLDEEGMTRNDSPADDSSREVSHGRRGRRQG
jgi:hypothetical protein